MNVLFGNASLKLTPHFWDTCFQLQCLIHSHTALHLCTLKGMSQRKDYRERQHTFCSSLSVNHTKESGLLRVWISMRYNRNLMKTHFQGSLLLL